MSIIYNFLKRNTSIKNISIGLLLIVLFNTFFLPILPDLMWNFKLPIKKILDLKFSYTSNIVYSLFNELGETGRNSYKLSALFIDIPYALVYGVTYAIIIRILLNTNKLSKHNYLILTPMLIGLFDVLENLGIAIMVTNYPERLERVATLTSLFTSLKWIFSGLTFLIIMSNLLKYVASKANRGSL